MGDSEFVTPEVCKSHHDLIDYKIESMNRELKDVKGAQSEYNATIKNIYYTLLVIAFGTILILAGMVLGRTINFPIPF